MKITRPILLLVLLTCLAGCSAQPQAAPTATALPVAEESVAGTLPEVVVTILPPTVEVVATTLPVVVEPTATAPVFKTSIGDLAYVTSRFVNEVNGTTPAPGCKLFLVVLERPDKTKIDLAAFSAYHMEIVIQGDDGSSTLSTMGGFVGPNHSEFAIGFQVPETAKTYTLVWGDNPPAEIFPE